MKATPTIPDESPLKFSFSAHLLEDLGVNLYTTLAKALVEFVANAYDANSPCIRIKFDTEVIEAKAEVCRKQFDLEMTKASSGDGTTPVEPLEKRTLDPTIRIVLEDEGHGMTKEEMESKFLVIGRRRREGVSGPAQSKDGKRLLMGRKGLGKLAGFGIAHCVEVASKAEGCDYTTVITLDYDALLGVSKGGMSEESVSVPTRIYRDSSGLRATGTRITLSRLVYQTLHSVNETEIVSALARHFGIISPKEFRIRVNSTDVKPPKRVYAYAWPEDAKRKHDQLVQIRYKDEDNGQAYNLGYRLRFTEEKKYLMAMERGVRVYAHNRLASFPSMLDVNSSAHGFRYSDYLDGIVVADFIDELPTDLIATDRSDLRWETPPLAGLRKFLSSEIQKAVGRFADKKMAQNAERVSKDPYTQSVIEKADLPDHRRKTALKFATALASSELKGVGSEYYKVTISEVISSLGHGDIITAINNLAKQSHPDLNKLVTEITRSTKREFDEFLKFSQVRIRGIEGLEKVVRAQDFRNKQCDEKSLHKLFAKNPWLIDSSLSQFLTSDERETVLAGRLAKQLKIGKHVPKAYNPKAPDEQQPLGTNKRPDLVFLLSNEGADHAPGRVIVVELKAPNTPLHSDHLDQLEDYIRSIEQWRDTPGRGKNFEVHGHLIGSIGGDAYKGNTKVQRLAGRIKNDGPTAKWKVRDIEQVLSETKMVHKQLISIFEDAKSGLD